MNTNKIIFAVLWAFILWLVLVLVSNLNTPSNNGNIKTSQWDMSIWILYDDAGDFSKIISWFKEKYPSYASKNIVVESFSDRLTYTNALTSAIISGQAPDVFVQSNGEISAFENQIVWIDPNLISPNDFRLRFKPVFWEDLVITDTNDSTIEFLKWVPTWYEALWIYYNRKFFLRPSEIVNWSDFLQEVQSISDKYTSIIPVALWNWSGVTRAAEIISALFVLEWRDALLTTDTNQVRQVLGMYSGFWERNGDNRYNILSAPFEDDTDIDYFANGDVAAMIWYPRDLLEIDEIWYQSSFLFATPFPKYVWSERRVSIDYNYFVINKDTPLMDMSQDFLQYLASQEWQQLYSDTFPYYLSPDVAIAWEMTEKKILPWYNIVYKNFVSEMDELVSYNVGNKNMFKNGITAILDMDSWQDAEFNEFSSYIICSTTKQNTLLNLSSPCK